MFGFDFTHAYVNLESVNPICVHQSGVLFCPKILLKFLWHHDFVQDKLDPRRYFKDDRQNSELVHYDAI